MSYLIFHTSCGDHSDCLGLTRFNTAKEAIFHFIADCARCEGNADESCMAFILQKLTVKNEEEVKKEIQTREAYLHKAFDIEDHKERNKYLQEANCYCDAAEDENDQPHWEHEGHAYRMWEDRERLISLLEEKDIHFNMEKLFPCGLFQHTYITSGNREHSEKYPETHISCRSSFDKGLEHVETNWDT